MQQIVVSTIEEGVQKAKDILYKQVDNKTILFLSGGNTPRPLYENLAKDGLICPAGVGMIDERFGEKMHENSNERMIAQTGFLNYLRMLNIPWYPILQVSVETDEHKKMEEMTKSYDTQVRDLLFHFPKSVGILGIGADGHTAGIPAGNWKMEAGKFDSEELVTSYDITSPYGRRITMTFTALSMLDMLIVFVFGEDKKWALDQIYTPGSIEDIPARFYQKPDIAKKTLIITDQNV